MACSYCRKKGHTKRSCPKQREEKIKIQRDRTNMFISIFPALISNPVVMGLMWWQFSKLFPVTRFFNDVVVGSVVIDAIPFLDVDVQALPPPLVMGSALQVAEDSQDYVNWLKEAGEDIVEGIGKQTIPTSALTGIIKEFFEFLGLKDYQPPKFTVK